jgi:hypothetical protein
MYTNQIIKIKKKIEATKNALKDLYLYLEATELKEYEAYINLQTAEVTGDHFDAAVEELCLKPLEAKTDALKLKELEERFPGAIMILSTGNKQYAINHQYNPVYDMIRCEDANITTPFFKDFGSKWRLMAEWHGLYIDVLPLVK